MKLHFEPFDGRVWNTIDVWDKDTNRVVGYIKSKSSAVRGIHISLFDGKYFSIATTYEECFGFVSGVQAVLNHMTASEYIKPKVVPADSAPIARRF